MLSTSSTDPEARLILIRHGESVHTIRRVISG